MAQLVHGCSRIGKLCRSIVRVQGSEIAVITIKAPCVRVTNARGTTGHAG
jgi:hypothetical protein